MKKVFTVFIAMVIFAGMVGALNPPGVPHSLIGKTVFYNGSLADGTNLSLYKNPDTINKELWLEENMGEWFELNLGNVDSSVVWSSTSSNLSVTDDLAWDTGENVSITAKKYRDDGLEQTAETVIELDTSKGYQIVGNMTLNELPSTPGLTQVDSSYTDGSSEVYVREPIINWTQSSDAFTDASLKDISGEVEYQLQVSLNASMSNLIVNETLVDIENKKIDNVNMSPYTDDLLVGTYYYRVRPYDGVDYGAWSSVESFEVVAMNYTMKLENGFNMVSFPHIKEVLSTGQTFESITPQEFIDLFPHDGMVKSITRWDSEQQLYPLPTCRYSYVPFPSPHWEYTGCSDFNISKGEGFYIEMNQSYNLSYAGRPIDSVNYSLKDGANLLGYNNRLDNIKPIDYINNFETGTITSIVRWDSEQQLYPLPTCRYSYVPFPNPHWEYTGCSDWNMTNGEAYFIYSENDTNLSVDFVEGNE